MNDFIWEVKDWCRMLFGAHNDWEDRFFSWLIVLFWLFILGILGTLCYFIPEFILFILGIVLVVAGPPVFFHYIWRIKK